MLCDTLKWIIVPLKLYRLCVFVIIIIVDILSAPCGERPRCTSDMVDPLKIFWVLTNSTYLGMYCTLLFNYSLTFLPISTYLKNFNLLYMSFCPRLRVVPEYKVVYSILDYKLFLFQVSSKSVPVFRRYWVTNNSVIISLLLIGILKRRSKTAKAGKL